MVEQEKPLHVQVAEALGWTDCRHAPGAVVDWRGMVAEKPDDQWGGFMGGEGCLSLIPRYDLDWSATGPLIEEHGISVNDEGGEWSAIWWPRRAEARGSTPLIAICNLLLALKAAGKL